MALRGTLFARWARRSIRGYSRRPFARLVAHFLARLVRGGQDSASAEFELGLGAFLGLLAAPGAVACFVLLNKYSSLLYWVRGWRHVDIYVVSLPDKYLFLSLAMAITGILTVLKWDRILPDSQDYLNLAPLPIRPRTIFLANAAAIAIAAMIVGVDVSAIPTVLFPLFATASTGASVGATLQFIGVHGLAVLLASGFTFFASFAVLGSLSAVLPREAFRACSSWVRGILLVGFVMLLFTGFAGQSLVRRLELAPHSTVRWLPSLWYLGVYQSLQHRAGPALDGLASTGLRAAAGAFALMALTYALGYRRRFAGVLEGGRRPSEQRLYALALRFLDLFSQRTAGFERACHRFAVRALLRNEAHRLVISVSIGLGWLLAFQTASSAPVSPSPIPPLALLEAPLIAAYVLILGLRIAFDLPASVAAAWIFRAILNPRENRTLPVARRVIFSFLVPLVLLPTLAFFWWRWNLPIAVGHTLYVLALSLCFVELLLAGYRKIPLTCPVPGFRDNFLLLCLIQFFGFECFTRLGAGAEHWMFVEPARFLLLPGSMLAAWLWNKRRLRDAQEAGELEPGLTFENAPLRGIERLNLSGGA
jgi:hypothetical protein